ncbi:transposase [Elysia marginata]|uniref:Transposase n=1 Tax=Elysia marginata TaxID=1093978 RepID=A0AAV4H798_9GAST|nr:transposase [Elysia marginata]
MGTETVEMKAQRKTICTQLLERFTHDGERFLRSIITGDESWVHHYDPESKMQSMQYRHKNSPAPKKFKVVASARKVLLTIFWDMEGIVHIEFFGARHNNKFREICVNSACIEGPTQTGSS